MTLQFKKEDFNSLQGHFSAREQFKTEPLNTIPPSLRTRSRK